MARRGLGLLARARRRHRGDRRGALRGSCELRVRDGLILQPVIHGRGNIGRGHLGRGHGRVQHVHADYPIAVVLGLSGFLVDGVFRLKVPGGCLRGAGDAIRVHGRILRPVIHGGRFRVRLSLGSLGVSLGGDRTGTVVLQAESDLLERGHRLLVRHPRDGESVGHRLCLLLLSRTDATSLVLGGSKRRGAGVGLIRALDRGGERCLSLGELDRELVGVVLGDGEVRLSRLEFLASLANLSRLLGGGGSFLFELGAKRRVLGFELLGSLRGFLGGGGGGSLGVLERSLNFFERGGGLCGVLLRPFPRGDGSVERRLHLFLGLDRGFTGRRHRGDICIVTLGIRGEFGELGLVFLGSRGERFFVLSLGRFSRLDMLGDGAIALLDRLLGSLELVAEFSVSVLELFRLFQRVGVVGEKLLGGGRGVIIAGLGALGRSVVVLRGTLLLARRCLADGLGALARGFFCALGLRGFGCHGFSAVIENEELVVHAEGEGEDVAVRERRGARDLLLVNLDTVPGVVRDGDDVRIGALGLVAGNDAVLCAH